MRALAQSNPRCNVRHPSIGVPMIFSPTIIISTESVVLILILLRAFHVI